jgi:hypothetical protein
MKPSRVTADGGLAVTWGPLSDPESPDSFSDSNELPASNSLPRAPPGHAPIPWGIVGVNPPPARLHLRAVTGTAAMARFGMPTFSPCTDLALPSGVAVAAAADARHLVVTFLLAGLSIGLTAGRSGEEDSKFESPPASPAPHVRPLLFVLLYISG